MYCSKTGNTEKVANAIKRGIGSDVDMVKLDLTPDGVLKNFEPCFTFDLQPYDLVIIGGWVMVMRAHPFIAGYINRSLNMGNKSVAGFMTGGAVFSRKHVYDDFKLLVEKKGAKVSDFLYVTTMLGPLLTKKKILGAEQFGRQLKDRM